MRFGFVVRLGEEVVDEGISAGYLLADPASGQEVRYGVVYSMPP